MKLTGKAKLAGIVGWPVSHSFSPLLHGFWLDATGVDGVLVPLPVRVEDFAAVMTALARAGFSGVSVTAPHKQAAFALAHESDAAARATGAANLLVFGADGRIRAANTDWVGLAQNLKETLGDGLAGKKVVMIGAGGAARAALLALQALKVESVHVLNRNPARAKSLAADFSDMRLVTGPLDDWQSAAQGAALLLNTSAAGMKGMQPLSLDLAALPAGAAVCDIVYNPLETPLLAEARARKFVTIDGLGMLLHQGVPAFEAFFGVRPVVTGALRAVLEQALAARG